MGESKVTDRIEFLAKKYDIFEYSDNELKKKLKELEESEYTSKVIEHDSRVLAISSSKVSDGKKKPTLQISISIDVFSEMIAADPTQNKSCVQWMLNVFTRFMREDSASSITNAIRFVTEDLPQASMYIGLFEANKRKKKFAELCSHSFILKHVSDPTDINQYKSLSQLFDAIDPFIERNPSDVERLMQKYVDAGQAEIPVRDRKFTVFVPKSMDANAIFGDFANWCTARKGNTMFTHYTTSYKKPNGDNSKIYIIINNKFFSGETDEIYQIHFETNQIKDRHNSSNVSIYESVLHESEGLLNYFYEELITMAKACLTGLDNNKYLDHLVRFGFCESVFELVDIQTPIIRFMTREIPKLPDISRFKNVDQLIITGAKMVELHSSIGSLSKLEMLVLTNNRIKELPSEIGNLKNLTYLNISGNPLVSIPDELANLDSKNGGMLFRVTVNRNDIGDENYEKIKRLLPSVNFSDNQKVSV